MLECGDPHLAVLRLLLGVGEGVAYGEVPSGLEEDGKADEGS
jgi:hypothetical protein